MKRLSLLLPLLWIRDHAPLVISHQNTWTSFSICVGTCKSNSTCIPCSTTASTCCLNSFRLARPMKVPDLCTTILSSLPPTTLMETKDSWVHPLLNLAKYFCFMHCNCQKCCRNFNFYVQGSLRLLRLFRPRHSQLPVLVSICLAEQVVVFCTCPDIKS
jgi:hypothetical protein